MIVKHFVYIFIIILIFLSLDFKNTRDDIYVIPSSDISKLAKLNRLNKTNVYPMLIKYRANNPTNFNENKINECFVSNVQNQNQNLFNRSTDCMWEIRNSYPKKRKVIVRSDGELKNNSNSRIVNVRGKMYDPYVGMPMSALYDDMFNAQTTMRPGFKIIKNGPVWPQPYEDYTLYSDIVDIIDG